MNKTIFLSGLLCSTLLMGCADTTKVVAHKEHGDNHDHSHDHDHSGSQTVKVGADLQFTHDFQAVAEVNRDTTVTISINHSYAAGRLDLVATDEGPVKVFQPTAEETVTLRAGSPVEWDISFRPTEDGTSYINVLGTVTDDSGYTSTRAYAIRIETGDVGQAKPVAVGPTVFQAEETFE